MYYPNLTTQQLINDLNEAEHMLCLAEGRLAAAVAAGDVKEVAAQQGAVRKWTRLHGEFKERLDLRLAGF